ncbi:hypothetical protein G352_21291 [Rhodococcus ruber BKS 20-38]|uniref:Uncharacterized protein n=1 Tax=Rhodococcus ruber BKS 20-38 TaxID=1278076 RepID=M2ZA47_9NOCA|nr:hypothetical protein G352_21291 [Rhodococcus ruber BKS 20-38]
MDRYPNAPGHRAHTVDTSDPQTLVALVGAASRLRAVAP